VSGAAARRRQRRAVRPRGPAAEGAQPRTAEEPRHARRVSGRAVVPVRAARRAGRFDKIGSIGVFERVGANFDAYFSVVRRPLKPGGLYLHHAITVSRRLFARLRAQRLRRPSDAGV
jgi:cyclopropane-fatty-acyl-phospholipid synthase